MTGADRGTGPRRPAPRRLPFRLLPVRPAGWWFDAVLVAAFTAITLTLLAGGLLGLDLAVRDWSDRHRPHLADLAARAGNELGQGTALAVICLVIALVLAWRRHSVRPVLPVLAAEVLTYATLGPLKLLTSRAAPHADRLPPYVLHPERLGSQAGGVSYPSGHLVNAIVWYGVLALLLAPWLPVAVRRLVRVLPPAVLAVTTVYLGYHWLTDTVAGILWGLLLDRILRRIPWDGVPLGRRLTATTWAGPGMPTPPGGGAAHDPPGGGAPPTMAGGSSTPSGGVADDPSGGAAHDPSGGAPPTRARGDALPATPPRRGGRATGRSA